MIVRVLRQAGAGLAVVALVAACDNNPLAENRDRGAYFDLNPSNVAVNAGGTVKVSAVVRNEYGAATNAAVTATPCDAKITAVRDTGRSAFEFPERFDVTGTNSLGNSCLVVSGGGLTDTIRVRVVPASIRMTGIDTVGSGQTATGTVRFLTTAGGDATGFDLSNVEFVSLTPTIATVDSTGAVSGQAPGQGQVLVRLRTGFGVTRVDTARFVVRAGAFPAANVALSTIGAPTGSIQVATFSQANIPFDADTQVEIVVDGATIRTWTTVSTGTTRQIVLPFGLPAGNLRYNVINIGPNQVAQTGTISLPNGTPPADLQEPDESFATPKNMTPGQVFYGSLATNDATDMIRLTVTEGGSHTITFQWNEASGNGTAGSDFDLYVYTAGGTEILAQETFSAAQESGTVTLAPGVYYIELATWAYVGTPGLPSTTYRVTAVRQ